MAEASDVALTAPKVRRPTFFGEPIGLGFLAFTEAGERFSFYGMTALLVLYMRQALFLPGRIEHISGFTPFRGGVEAVFGHMTTAALASQIYGLYTGFVYFTPVFGGLIADRWIGRRNAVVCGALLMAAGHIAMTFDATFLVALALLITGCGLLKGNISAQVGALYRQDDATGRTRGFSIFSMGINVGAVAGPLACGILAQLYGWHAGFGLASILMLVALAIYTLGYRTLTETRAVSEPAVTAPLSRAQWRTIAVLFVVMFLSIFQSIAYYQNSNAALVWINRYVDLDLFGFHIPVAWFNAIDSFVSIVSVPFLFALWRWQESRGGEPGEITKISIGAWMAAAANLMLVIGSATGAHVSALFPVVYDVLLGVAFLYYWPTLLALVSRAAPPQIKATLMGVVFLTLFISNLTMGRLGALYETMDPMAFWAMNVAIAAVGGVLAFVLNRPLSRLLAAD